MKKNNSPILSVIMPVFNGERYLYESINSVLNQSFKNFEFIIINDCSTDKTNHILSEYKSLDNRIVIINNLKNKGIAYSLNEAIKTSKSDLIVRMDSDDVCMPSRFQKQFDYMSNNPLIAVSGTGALINNSNRLLKDYFIPFTKDAHIKTQLLFESPFVHPSIIFRKEVFFRNKMQYDSTYSRAEDYKLWTQFARISNMGNIINVGLSYRVNVNSVSNKYKSVQLNDAGLIREEYFKQIGIPYTESEFILHNRIPIYDDWFTLTDLIEVEKWFLKLLDLNRANQYFEKTAFYDILSTYWERAVIKSELPLLMSWKLYRESVLFNKQIFNLRNFLLSSVKNKIKKIFYKKNQ